MQFQYYSSITLSFIKIVTNRVENIEKVQGAFFNAGQFQIIFGTGTVNRIYDEVVSLGLPTSTTSEMKAEAAKQGNWFQRAVRTFGDVFVPIIPAIVATGLFMGLRGLLEAFGGLGNLALPYIKTLTTLLGQGIGTLLSLQPVIMCLLLAVIFCMLIVSPFTTVGIAVAISLSGVGSGAANLGICAAGFGLAIAGWKVNPKGTAIAHFIGSPKMSMANVLAKPKILLPMMCTSAVLGVLAALLNIQGTPQSAGFGFSGLVGPINALNLAEGGWSVMNIVIVTLIFVVAPIALNIVFVHLFEKVLKWIQPEDYKLTV